MGEVAWTAALVATRETLRRYPGIDPDLVLSDACLGAAQALHRHDPGLGAGLFSYCLQRARGAVLDGMRERSDLTRLGNRRRPAETSLDVTLRLIPHPRCDTDEVEDRLDVERILDRLPPRLAQVLREHDLNDRPIADVARLLGVTQSRVCQLRRQALEAARQLA